MRAPEDIIGAVPCIHLEVDFVDDPVFDRKPVQFIENWRYMFAYINIIDMIWLIIMWMARLGFSSCPKLFGFMNHFVLKANSIVDDVVDMTLLI